MLDFLESLLGVGPKCPKCGHRTLKKVARTEPAPVGRDPFKVYKCQHCGAIVDPPPQYLQQALKSKF